MMQSQQIPMTFQRYETKYMLSPIMARKLRKSLPGHLQMDEYGLDNICSLYYDTPDHQLIRRSLEKTDIIRSGSLSSGKIRTGLRQPDSPRNHLVSQLLPGACSRYVHRLRPHRLLRHGRQELSCYLRHQYPMAYRQSVS